ncbi:hypothetical protein NE237_013133 [Protea cynaroides]|uniref:Uncharacterized protein n=1 Tax=Protea cynaroides TaxID=273540 RepID=A0A9Q0H1F8_9MAGN|nr:hypothetical protein NE237_013133 [Protea cynaroides]
MSLTSELQQNSESQSKLAWSSSVHAKGSKENKPGPFQQEHEECKSQGVGEKQSHWCSHRRIPESRPQANTNRELGRHSLTVKDANVLCMLSIFNDKILSSWVSIKMDGWSNMTQLWGHAMVITVTYAFLTNQFTEVTSSPSRSTVFCFRNCSRGNLRNAFSLFRSKYCPFLNKNVKQARVVQFSRPQIL